MKTKLPFLHTHLSYGRMLLLSMIFYAAYLPFTGYTKLPYDAAQYWDLAAYFSDHRHFSLLHYPDGLRGYLYPLMLFGPWVAQQVSAGLITPLGMAGVLGVGWSGMLFGVAIPQLWKQVTGRPLSAARWLGLMGMAFIFWRNYFSFTVSDMPALTLLLLGLGALSRPGWRWALVAGGLLAAAINIRPIYIASVPGALLLLVATRHSAEPWLGRCAGLVLGSALILLPQGLLNWQHFHQATPLVLARLPAGRLLYLNQLGWGTASQRYESSLIPERPRALIFADSAGQRALVGEPGHRFSSYGHYAQFALRQPIATSARYLRHLFNGLDIRFPTPYPRQLHPPGQAVLRLLNYALLGLGAWLALATWRKTRRAAWEPTTVGTLLALLLPCLLALPTLMECRFLLPLHLLVLTAVAGAWQPAAWWRALGPPARRVAFLAVAAGWLWGCWQLSEATAGQLRPPNEAPQE